jgi:hypothetical protein
MGGPYSLRGYYNPRRSLSDLRNSFLVDFRAPLSASPTVPFELEMSSHFSTARLKKPMQKHFTS